MTGTVWIGLDLSTHCGWAIAWPDGTRYCGTWDLSNRNRALPCERISRLDSDLTTMLQVAHHDHPGKRVVIAYEHPRRHAGTIAAQWFGAYWGSLMRAQDRHGLSLVPAQPEVWAAWAGVRGRRDARKAAALRIAEGRGWVPKTDDEADACLIVDWARANATLTGGTTTPPEPVSSISAPVRRENGHSGAVARGR